MVRSGPTQSSRSQTYPGPERGRGHVSRQAICLCGPLGDEGTPGFRAISHEILQVPRQRSPPSGLRAGLLTLNRKGAIPPHHCACVRDDAPPVHGATHRSLSAPLGRRRTSGRTSGAGPGTGAAAACVQPRWTPTVRNPRSLRAPRVDMLGATVMGSPCEVWPPGRVFSSGERCDGETITGTDAAARTHGERGGRISGFPASGRTWWAQRRTGTEHGGGRARQRSQQPSSAGCSAACRQHRPLRHRARTGPRRVPRTALRRPRGRHRPYGRVRNRCSSAVRSYRSAVM